MLAGARRIGRVKADADELSVLNVATPWNGSAAAPERLAALRPLVGPAPPLPLVRSS